MTSLSRQFNFVFLVIVALPVLFVCLLLSWFYMNALLDVVTQQTEALSTQMAQNVGNEIDRVSIFSAALLYDADLQRATDQYIQVKVGPDHTTLAQAITEKLSIALTYTNRIGAIVLYMKDKSVLSFNNYPNIRSFVPPEGPAFDQARQNQGNIIVADNLSGVTGNIGERFIISALSSPLSTEIPSGIDTILVMFRIPYLDQLASNDSSSNGSNILIYSRNGRPILSSLKHPLSDQRVKLFLGQNTIIRDFQIKESSAFLVSRQVESAGWTVATLVDKAFITSKLTGYQWYIYPALIFILGLFFIYEMTFFSRIANPIQTLSSTMNLVGQGNYEFSLPQTGVKEIDQLVNSFNSMVMEIKRLNEERVHREQKRLEAEISALQFQINPHFMANTLNSIRLMAIASKAKGIKDMTQALIRIVADSYATSQPLTALVQEIENVRSYFYIMKVRFGEHIQIDYQIAQETENLEVLRMILQPIVENSILHGFAQKSELGLIKITSRLDTLGRLNIEITDNGVGMSPQRIQEVFYQDRAEQNKGPNFNRIGIKNVQDRIRLHFGNEYGLTIQSIPDQGTTVTFILPGMPVNKSLSEEKMYKVLTVDDEPFVRVSLASLRTWQDDGFDFCYEASNGQQALEILEKYQDISIILLDLIMPVLDGISFLEKFNALKTSLKNFSPSVIVLSSHDSFALVRQAFTLGVSDYVLKTEIEEDNLLNLLKKAIEKQPQETKINTLTFEEEHRDFLRSQLLHDLLINPPSEDCTEMLTRLGLSFSLPLVLCSLRILDFDTVAARFSQDEAGHFNELLIRTIRMIMGKDWSGEVIQVTRDQSAIFLTAPQEYENIIPLQNALKESLERYLNIRIELNFSPELRGLDEVSEVWSRLIKPATGGSRIVVLAKRYLTEHYKESKISLSDLSAFVGVSRNHLSWEFTRETGETITEYLAHLRMNEAAQLLRTTTLKVYEVAEQLGYSNVEHFSRIFKKVMGVSPNHYTGAQDA